MQFGLPHCNPAMKNIPLATSSVVATARLWKQLKRDKKESIEHTLVTVSLPWSTDGALLFLLDL